MHADSRITFAQWAAALTLAMALHAMFMVGLPAQRSFGSSGGSASAGARSGAPSRIRLALGRAPAPLPEPGPATAQQVPAAATRVPPAPAAVAQAAAVVPAADPEASRTPSPLTAAAGSGTAASGPGGSAQENAGPNGSGGSSGARIDYFEALYGQVLSILDYPRRARLEEIEGTVVLVVRIDRSGRLETCEIADSSGSRLLDRHALRIVRRAAPFGAVPPSLEDTDLSFELPLAFTLE